MAESSAHNGNAIEFKEKDRVQRTNGQGPLGFVVSIRHDSAAVSSTREESGVLVGVNWDNGSYSFFTPSALKHHKA